MTSPTRGRGVSGCAVRTETVSPAKRTHSASRTATASPAGEAGPMCAPIQPRARNQPEPVAAGHGTKRGKLGQVRVSRKWLATEKTTAARKNPRDSGVCRARPIAGPTKGYTGIRYRLPSDQPPCQFGYAPSIRSSKARAQNTKRQSARSSRDRHHRTNPTAAQAKNGEKSKTPRAG